MTDKPTYEELEQRVRELETRENRYRLLFDQMNSGFALHEIVVNENGNPIDYVFLEINSAFETLTGLSRQDVLHKKVTEVLSGIENDPADWIGKYGQVALTGREFSFEHYSLPLGRWYSVQAFRHENGQFATIFEDVTERRRVEEALRKTSESLQAILDNSPLLISEFDLEGRYIRVNNAVAKLLERHSSELIGKAFSEILPAETAELFMKRLDLVSNARKPITLEDHLVTPEAGQYFITTIFPLFDASGQIRSIGGIATDITERKKAELLLEAERAQLRSLFEYSGEAILLLDLENHILDANSGFKRIFGYSPEEARGKIIEDLICPERFYYTESKELDAQSLDGIKDVEIIRKRKDGEEIGVRVSAGPIKLGDRMTGRFVVFDDIAERKKAEEDLRQERERLAGIIRGTNAGTWEWSVQTGETIFNERWAEIVGYTLDEISPVSIETWMRFSHPDDLKISNELLEMHFRGELDYYEFESRMKHKSGDWVWVLDRGRVISWTQDGKPLMMMGTHQDINRRKIVEEALRESERRFQRMLGVVPDMISIHSPEMDILYSNWQGFAAVPAAKQIPNTKCYKTYRGFDKICADCQAGAVLESRKPIQKEVLLPDGTWVDLRAIPFLDEANNVEMFMEWVRDITDRKQAEEEREKLHDQLAQSQKIEAIGSLAGGVAHDLNNLLSPILGYGEMLRDDLDPEDARRESVDEIISAGLRARDLVRQLLAFSRKQILEFRPLNLNKVTAGLERLLRYTIREDIQMEFDLTPDAGVVMADIGQIEQVIMNLSVNAAYAMPEGGNLTIETQKVYLDEEYAKHHTSVKPGEYVMLAVSDSGVGMDEATRERIFDPFFSTKGEMGTGLGLATVYGIVKQHGGNIWVYSEPGKGSTFKVYLPVVETSEPEETTAAEKIKDLKGSETILIVEDSDQVRRLAESVLKRNGYHVLTAKDGAQALEAMASHARPVNLLLTDVVLPGMNGRELYEKAAEASPSMKVLYMSGYTDNVIAHRGVLDEGIQFIQKPFTVYGLAVKVRKVLDEKPRK